MPQENGGVPGGVGATALYTAAARAIETHRRDSLLQDAYAEHFVRAAPVSAHWPVHPRQVPGGPEDPVWGRLGRYCTLRSRVIDDFVLRSVREGARRVVLLGAGLDTRAFRLDWPPGCTVFEVDTAGVLEFKRRVLDGLSAVERTARVPVVADLRADWAAALSDAGFETGFEAGVWVAEGLLFYLPGPAETSLVSTLDHLSAPGSSLVFDTFDATVRNYLDNPLYAAVRDRIGIDLPRLLPGDPRPDTAAALARGGWSVSVRTPDDFARRYAHGAEPEGDALLAHHRWVRAHKPRGDVRRGSVSGRPWWR